MNNKEKLPIKKSCAERVSDLLHDRVKDFLAEDTEVLKNNKEVLAAKIEESYAQVEKKKNELNRAIEQKESHDAILILFAEYQQKNLVLRDLEMSIIALEMAMSRKSA